MNSVLDRRYPTEEVTFLDKVFAHYYCWLFTLQAGTVVFVTIGWTVMLSTSILNLEADVITDDERFRLIQYTVFYIYTTCMMVAYGFIYYGSLKPSLPYLRFGFCMIVVFWIYWVIISILSFVNVEKYNFSVCLDERCPPTHWFYNTNWRNYEKFCGSRTKNNQSREEDLELKVNKNGNEIVWNQTSATATEDPQEYGLDEHEEMSIGVAPNNSLSSNDRFYDLWKNYSRVNNTNSSSTGRSRMRKVNFESLDVSCNNQESGFFAEEIFGFILWFCFSMYGTIGVFALMMHIKRMNETGEISEAVGFGVNMRN